MSKGAACLATILQVIVCTVFTTAGFADSAKTYNIDVILPETGGAAFLGKEEQKALALAEQEVNNSGGIHGQPIRFAIVDDQSSPQISVQLSNRIIARHPAVLLGSSLVSACNAMAPLMKEGPVMYCFSPGIHPPAGSYVFTASVSTFDAVGVMIGYFRQRGWKRIALITSADATGQDAEHAIDAAMANPANKDLTITDRAHFNITDVSVAAQIDHIQQSKPQVLVAWSTGTPVATVFKGIVEAGLEIPVATSYGNMTYTQMKQYAGFLPKDLYISSPGWLRHAGVLTLDPKVEAAQARFFGAYDAVHIKPGIGASLAWDPAMILVDALRHLPPNATADKVRAYLSHLKGFAGINGLYDFPSIPQRGLDGRSVVMTRWNPAKSEFQMVSKPGGTPLSP